MVFPFFLLSHTANSEIFFFLLRCLTTSHTNDFLALGQFEREILLIELIHCFLTDVFRVVVSVCHTVAHSLRHHRAHRELSFCLEGPKNTRTVFFLSKREGMLILLGPAPFSSQPPKKKSRRPHTTNKTLLAFRGTLAQFSQTKVYQGTHFRLTLITSLPDFLHKDSKVSVTEKVRIYYFLKARNRLIFNNTFLVVHTLRRLISWRRGLQEPNRS